MKKTAVLSILLVAVQLAVAVIAEAQQPTKIPRLGYLGSVSSSARIEAFHQGLRELGYVEGKNISIEWRLAEGKLNRLAAFAARVTASQEVSIRIVRAHHHGGLVRNFFIREIFISMA